MKATMKKYKCNIIFSYEAPDENEALAIADNIAEYVETAEQYGNSFSVHHIDVEAKVGEPIINKN